MESMQLQAPARPEVAHFGMQAKKAPGKKAEAVGGHSKPGHELYDKELSIAEQERLALDLLSQRAR